MANSINRITIMGRVGKNPSARALEGGNAMSTFSIATGEKFKDKATGEWKEQTEWHNVAAFGKTAQYCNTYVMKGARVYIEGKMQYREWLDQNQVKQRMASILADKVILLDKREANPAREDEAAYHEQEQTQPPAASIDDDETVPF